MKPYPLLFLVSLALVGCGELQKLSKDDVPRLQRIDAKVHAEKFEEALKEATAYLQQYPDSARGWCLLGWVHAKSDRLDDANDCFEKSLKLDPRWDNAYVGKGVVHRKQGNLQKARESYLEATRIQPDNAEAFSSLMVIEILEKDYKKAAIYGEKGWALRKDLGTIPANLAIAYHYLKDDQKKQHYYNEAKRLNYPRLQSIDEIFEGKRVIE